MTTITGTLVQNPTNALEFDATLTVPAGFAWTITGPTITGFRGLPPQITSVLGDGSTTEVLFRLVAETSTITVKVVAPDTSAAARLVGQIITATQK